MSRQRRAGSAGSGGRAGARTGRRIDALQHGQAGARVQVGRGRPGPRARARRRRQRRQQGEQQHAAHAARPPSDDHPEMGSWQVGSASSGRCRSPPARARAGCGGSVCPGCVLDQQWSEWLWWGPTALRDVWGRHRIFCVALVLALETMKHGFRAPDISSSSTPHWELRSNNGPLTVRALPGTSARGGRHDPSLDLGLAVSARRAAARTTDLVGVRVRVRQYSD